MAAFRRIIISVCLSLFCVAAKAAEMALVPDSLRTLVYRVGEESLVMHWVEGGSFMMGATPEQKSDRISTDRPAHMVVLNSFYIAETEVTLALWKAVMPEWSFFGRINWQQPVNYVDFADCQEFIRRLDSITRLPFRLPSEAEWEFAARGGNQSRSFRFAGSNSIEDVAWTLSNAGYYPHSVKQKSPNELGLFDMTGNVSEWCSDYYAPYYMGTEPNPKGPKTGEWRIARGAGFDNCKDNSHLSFRQYLDSTTSSASLGLRLALSLPSQLLNSQQDMPDLVRSVKIGMYHYRFRYVPADKPFYIAEQNVSNAFWKRIMKDNREGRLTAAATGMSQSQRRLFVEKCTALAGCSFDIATEEDLACYHFQDSLRTTEKKTRVKRWQRNVISIQQHRKRVKRANVWLELLNVKLTEPEDPTLSLFIHNPQDDLPLRLVIRL